MGHGRSTMADLFQPIRITETNLESSHFQRLSPLFHPALPRQPTHQNYHYVLVSSHCRLEEGQHRFMPWAKCVYSNSSPVSALSETDTHKHTTSERLQQLTSEGLNPSGSGSNRLDYVIATICYEK